MKNKPTINYILSFSGWVQCRMATDPDPTNDPRGVSGYSFALPGEPDLDRIVYFQNRKGVVRRSFCPEVGVRVQNGYEYHTEGTGGETTFVSKRPIEAGHPLYEAKVDLLGNPTFDSRNGTIIFNGFGIVNPFIFDIQGTDVHIQRRFFTDPENEQEDLEHYPIELLTPYTMNTVVPDAPSMILWGKVLQRSAFRNERLQQLKGELADCEDPIQIAALNKRINELEINNPNNRRTKQIGTKALLSYPLNAKTAQYNGKTVEPDQNWDLELWMGAWDADSLCFWAEGYVQISI
ncbi:MAG: hypothetical protein AAGD05_05105 [Bacteroidota bacterium]